MATGLPGYNVQPMNYLGKDGILFHLKDDMSVFLKLSATTDMAYSSQMEVTTQPVQTGQVITDNIQEKPKTIQISGVVVVGYEGAFLQSRSTTVVEDFVNTLEQWRNQRRVLRVLCKDGITLENAVCTSFEAKKDKTVSNGLNISLTFQDVTFVVQVGQTSVEGANGKAQNPNGSKAGAKAKDGAVKTIKEAGKTGTQKIQPGSCEDVMRLKQSGAKVDFNLAGAVGSCQRGYSVDRSTGKVSYKPTDLDKYMPNNKYQAMGGNVNKQVKS